METYIHRMRLNPYFIPGIKCNSKCIKDPSVGAKTTEPLQDTKNGFMALNEPVTTPKAQIATITQTEPTPLKESFVD